MGQVNLTDYDFSNLSDLELGVLQNKARRFPEDKDFVDAVLQELSKRDKRNLTRRSSRAADVCPSCSKQLVMGVCETGCGHIEPPA